MSFKALAWAFEQDVPNPDKSVLIALAYRDNHDEPHGCYPSVPRIAKDCGINERTVQRCLSKLERSGLIRRQIRPYKSAFYFMPLAWVVAESHHPGVRQSPPLVAHSHPEPKVLTVIERKPRRESRAARNRFDEEINRRREAKQRRLMQEAEVQQELMVGSGPR